MSIVALWKTMYTWLFVHVKNRIHLVRLRGLDRRRRSSWRHQATVLLLRGQGERKNSCRHSRSSMVSGIGFHGLWLMCRIGLDISRQEYRWGYWRFGTSWLSNTTHGDTETLPIPDSGSLRWRSLGGMTKCRKERSFRERKISHERKVLFQLFGSNYLFLLIQNTIFDMIIICFVFKMTMDVV